MTASPIWPLARHNLRRYAAAVRAEIGAIERTRFDTDRSKTPRRARTSSTASRRPASTSARWIRRCRSTWRRCARRLRRGRARSPGVTTRCRRSWARSATTSARTPAFAPTTIEPLAIREIKRFIMEQEQPPVLAATAARAGPGGHHRRWSSRPVRGPRLASAGLAVTIFEAHPYAGGMVGGAIPAYRLPQAEIDQDLAVLERLGVEIRYGQKAGVDFTLDDLRAEGFDARSRGVVRSWPSARSGGGGRRGRHGRASASCAACGRATRSHRARVGVIGAGDTAMDCARSALALGAEQARSSTGAPSTRCRLIARRSTPARRGHQRRRAGQAPRAAGRGRHAWSGLVCTPDGVPGRPGCGPAARSRTMSPGSEFEIPLRHDASWRSASTRCSTSSATTSPDLTERGYIDVDPGDVRDHRCRASTPAATWRPTARRRSSRRPPTARPWQRPSPAALTDPPTRRPPPLDIAESLGAAGPPGVAGAHRGTPARASVMLRPDGADLHRRAGHGGGQPLPGLPRRSAASASGSAPTWP